MKPEVVGLDLLAAEAGGVEQGPDTGPAALVQHLEAVLDQDAVLSLQRHHVGHGGERDQIEQVKRQVGRQSQRRHQRLHQLEGDARAAELIGAGGVVFPLGIYDGERRGQLALPASGDR